jgi:hypothetical protein
MGQGELEGLKGLWAETTTIRVEKMLRPLIDAARRYLEAQRRIRLDKECQERQRKKAGMVRQAKADEANEAFHLRQQLLQDADRWHQSQKIREYLAAMEKRIESREIRPTDPDRFPAWMDWAKRFADDMDPMVQAPPREKPPTEAKNTPVGELDLTSRARNLMSQLGIEDSDALLLVPHEKVQKLAGWNSGVWQELTLVLEGLGYDVTKRHSSNLW